MLAIILSFWLLSIYCSCLGLIAYKTRYVPVKYEPANEYLVKRGKKEADELYNMAMEAYQESLENGGFRND